MLNAKERILSGLNESQQKVASDVYGNMMVNSCPGSGKTRTLIARAAYMIEDGINPSSILMFTFTKKAANEIKERLKSTVGEKAIAITVSTYHSFCAMLLRRYCSYAGLGNKFVIYDDEDKKNLIKKIIINTSLKIPVDEKISETVKKLSFYIAKQKEKMFSPKMAIDAAVNNREFVYPELANVFSLLYETYEKKLLQNNAVDFDNLIIMMVKIMRQYPEVRNAITSRWKYLIADEVQDSSIVDVNFIFLLGEENGNMCLTGDTDQSIYRFRGANTDYLNKRVDDNKTFKFYALGQNYRSTKNIVGAYASLIKQNPRKYNFDVHTDNNPGTKVILKDCMSAKQESFIVADTIKKVLAISKQQSKKWNYSNFSILCRMTMQTRVIEDALLERNIPYKIVSGTSFYSRKEVKDIMSYLYFIYNPNNLASLERIINIPKRKIGEKSYQSLEEQVLQTKAQYGIMDINKMIDILSNCKLKGSANKGLVSFVSTIKDMSNKLLSNSLSASKAVRYVIDTINYHNYLNDSAGEGEEQIETRMDNLLELQSLASKYSSIDEFVENMMLIEANEKTNNELDDNGKVQIMTIHASKGLEFDVVFLIGINDGIIPSFRCQNEKDVQEERRLMYVAMSRAKELLHITVPKSTIRNGTMVSLSPSPFLKEINDNYVSKAS